MQHETQMTTSTMSSSMPRDGTASGAAAPDAQPRPIDDLSLHTPDAIPEAKPLEGHTLDEAFIEELVALRNAEPLSDDELERQALEHPGADGDPATPE